VVIELQGPDHVRRKKNQRDIDHNVDYSYGDPERQLELSKLLKSRFGSASTNHRYAFASPDLPGPRHLTLKHNTSHYSKRPH
jgi:hypothetical protein